MFSECSSLQNVDGLINWNVSNGTNFERMFYDRSSLKNVDGLKNWNVSNGTNFRGMLGGCDELSDDKIPKNISEKI